MSLALRDYLETRRRAELDALYAFWVGGEEGDEDALVDALEAAMSCPSTVKERIAGLDPQGARMLSAAVRETDGALEPAQVTGDGADGREVEVALARLVQHGFLVVRQADGGAGGGFVVPDEVARAARKSLLAGPEGLDRAFSLDRFTRGMTLDEVARRAAPVERADADDREALLERLRDPAHVEERIRRLGDHGDREWVRELIHGFGGLLPRSRAEKLGGLGEEWSAARLAERLEGSLLGTCAPLSLEEYGIGLMEETAVVFVEVLESCLLGTPPVEGPFERVAATGIDWLSDLAELTDEIARGEIRLTQKGDLYKNSLRRFSSRMHLSLETWLAEEDHVEAMVAALRDLRLVRAGADRVLRPTELLSKWEQLAPHERVEKSLQAVTIRAEPGEPVFHVEPLRARLFDVLKELEVGRWIDPMAPAFVARNRYLANLERDRVKEAYQAKYQYAGPPMHSDPARLAWNLFEFTRRRLQPLGIVDFAMRGERIAALRLTSLGALALGVDGPTNDEKEDGQRRRLVVDSDFEVTLFPQGRHDPLIHELDRFATRGGAENLVRFRIEKESVTRAVAAGATADEILGLLERHARHEVPQGVTYSIREWADRVRFVSCERVFVLRAPDASVIDRIRELPGMRSLIVDRPTPTTLALRERPDRPAVRNELESLGVFVR